MKITDVRKLLAYRDIAPHRPIKDIKYIIIHHNAIETKPDYNPLELYKQEAQYHYNKDWGNGVMGSGIMYHYTIDREGHIYFCRNLGEALWHCGNYRKNLESIAICLDGHLTNQKPSTAQLVTLAEFLRGLCTQHPEFPAGFKDVFGHREISATNCPGDNLIEFVKDFRESEGQVNIADYPQDIEETTPEEPQTPEIETPCPEIEESLKEIRILLMTNSAELSHLNNLLGKWQDKVESANKKIAKLEKEKDEIDEERKTFQRLYKDKLDNDISKATGKQILSALLSRFNLWKNG